MLPDINKETLDNIQVLLRGRLKDGTIYPVTTEHIIHSLINKNKHNNKDNAYYLLEFALNVTLSHMENVRWLGTGWVLEEEWREFQRRPSLKSPRQPNIITLPPGVKEINVNDEETKERKTLTIADTPEDDMSFNEYLEQRREHHIQSAVFTLRDGHYYGNWIPLTKDLQNLFPPRAFGSYEVVFHYSFGERKGTFRAWVDWEHERILGSREMYESFSRHEIYPGTKLIISRLYGEYEYEIRTKQLEEEKTLLVRRIFLNEYGELEYEEVEKRVKYEIVDDVFIASARWEDIEALFRQADIVGAGIFQLMYETCVQWWEKNNRAPLTVTAQELWEAIHYNDTGRLTTKATIAWELWRRLAFKPVGKGRYLFRPEYGDKTRKLDTGKRRLKHNYRTYAAIRKSRKVYIHSNLEHRPKKLYSLYGVLWIINQIGGIVAPADIFEIIEEHGNLDEYYKEIDPNGQIRYRHIVHAHLQHLKRSGYIEHVGHAQWRITEKGKEYLRKRYLLDS